MKPTEPQVPPAELKPVAPPQDKAAAAIAAIAKDAKANAEEYVKSTTVPGGGE